jgi:transposase-like protein
MSRTRRYFSPEDKVKILRRHLIDHVPISKLSDENDIAPVMLYQWLKQFFENGAAAFERPRTAESTAAQKTIAKLQEKIQAKNEVVAELMEEHVKLKKSLGEP